LGDGKWTDYLDHCDRFFWGLLSRAEKLDLLAKLDRRPASPEAWS